MDLDADRALVARLWNASQESCLPLSMAAAFTFHQTSRTSGEQLPRSAYDTALDIAAAALSRFIPIYTVDRRGERVAALIDLVRQKFRGGATQLLRDDGSVLAPLSIVRSDAVSTLLAIGRSGITIEYLAPRVLQSAAP